MKNTDIHLYAAQKTLIWSLPKPFTISVSMHATANNFARSGISNSSLLIKKRGTIKTTGCVCNGKALAMLLTVRLQNTVAEPTVARQLLRHNNSSLVPSAL